MTRAAAHIAAMAGYVLPSLALPPGVAVRSLSQNECHRGPSPHAVAAMQAAAEDTAPYPDPDWHALRAALADLWGLDAAQILCGGGSLELIGALMRIYAGPDRAVLIPEHVYPYFRTAAGLAGARLDIAAETALTADPQALLDAVQPDTGVLCLANPGNPTGTRLSHNDIRALRAALRPDVLLILDEAYGEFADGLEPPCFDLVAAGNTVVLRTLSKAYGMAGARVGWGLFPPDIAGEMRKVLSPNTLSTVTQAGAVAAITDQAYMRETCAQTAHLRALATAQLRALGLRVPDSHTNFVLIDFETPARAQAVDAALKAQGLILRGQAGVGLPQCLRMTLGPDPWVRDALDVIAAWRKETP